MPITYRVDHERKVLVAEVQAPLVDADLLDYAERLLSDETAKLANHELADLRNGEQDVRITTGGVQQLAAFWREASDRIAGGKLAILVSSKLSYGMARMYQQLRDDGPDTIQVFTDEDAAWEWLQDEDDGV